MLKIALIADELTSTALRGNRYARVLPISVQNARRVFRFSRPDLFIVESAWLGHKDTWRYQLASYPDYPERNNTQLRVVVEMARHYGIPAVFWNREDGAHFNRFIKTAALFDHVLTVDENMLPHYKQQLPAYAKVGTLPFAISPKLHHPGSTVFRMPRTNRSLFIGSYSQHIHERRRQWQNMLFQAATQHGRGLVIYDRNSSRKPEHYRYPDLPNLSIKPAVPYQATGKVYGRFNHCLNVNTVDDSPTMFSRRLIEIMACGTLAVTNPSLSVSRLFDGMCEVVDTQEQADHLLEQLGSGLTKHQQEMCRYASQHVLKHYTYEIWLDKIKEFVGI
ncbi:glycosyltransferase [Alkanindiges sp. WGS2144]|uniref:CgeB family protein n=1 Tax=Alkanindiges sp. WGS2144 TaxID=3366808 RepID=UPI003751F681